MEEGGLTPVQRRTLEALRRTESPVVFDPAFVADLRADAAQALDELVERLDGEQLNVNKRTVGDVLTCESHFLDDEPFAWSPALACGKVAHRAVELLVHWRGEPTPATLVDEALARLADDDSALGDWVAGLTDADAADVRGRAVTRVTQFVECFPPLRPAWRPVTESQVRWPLEAPLTLRARADIVIGRPIGQESRKVLIDLKTGRIVARHREDLRFYALVETLAREVPPRAVASFSLEAGEASVELVTEAMLRSALRRTLDAASRIIELTVEGATPTPPPSIGCFRCRDRADTTGEVLDAEAAGT